MEDKKMERKSCVTQDPFGRWMVWTMCALYTELVARVLNSFDSYNSKYIVNMEECYEQNHVVRRR